MIRQCGRCGPVKERLEICETRIFERFYGRVTRELLSEDERAFLVLFLKPLYCNLRKLLLRVQLLILASLAIYRFQI